MGEVVQFPGKVKRLGFKRVRKSCHDGDPNQLDLFMPTIGRIENFESALSVYDQALQCDARGDPRAAEFYHQAIQREECVADSYCNLGILECKGLNFTRAFDCFTLCLKRDARHLEAHYNLATLYMDMNDYRLAQVHFEIAVEINPDFAPAFFSLGIVLSMSNELGGAINALTRYQQLAPAEDAKDAEDLLVNLRRADAARRDRP